MLVTLDIVGVAATSGDSLQVDAKLDDGRILHGTFAIPAGRHGTVEIDFGAQYPSGQAVMIELSVTKSNVVIASRTLRPTLPDGCDSESVIIGDTENDAGVPDGEAPGNLCSQPCTGNTPICLAPNCAACMSAADPEAACANFSATSAHCLASGTGAGSCVQCRDENDCTAAASICDAQQHTCRGCQLDEECASKVCDLTPGSVSRGQCVDVGKVVYVDGSGKCSTSNPGTASAPLCSIAMAQAVPGKTTIHVGNANFVESLTFDNGSAYTIVGEKGAQITALATSGPVVTVKGSSRIALRNLLLVGAGNFNAIECSGGSPTLAVLDSVVQGSGGYGISTDAGCAALIDRCAVTSNVAGGIRLRDAFDVRNSVIASNGNSTTAAGGGVIVQASAGVSKVFINNTITDNLGRLSGAGMSCSSTVNVVNTILALNRETNAFTISELSGSCTTSFSATDDKADGSRAGSNNIDLSVNSPGFVSAGNYHLSASSPCRDRGTAVPVNDHDRDGQPRPDPTSGKTDIGAYEIQ